ncbi:MAG: BlaI/MecI/CopY family transcriptional regulator [Clostridia bacterium]|nr:BlaI/MecI/CopY family transcriptional regulator [Clostridia bacterium]
METTLYDSELRLMELLWDAPQPLTAKEISLLAAGQIGWSRNTTYTVLTKLVGKGVLRREEPGFRCVPLATREEVQRAEARSLLQRLFGGSKRALVSALLEDGPLSDAEAAALREMIDRNAGE